jgi:signal transduction histidine kinase
MKRVMDNLLDNAAKFSPEHSTIALRVSQITSYTLFSLKIDHKFHVTSTAATLPRGLAFFRTRDSESAIPGGHFA